MEGQIFDLALILIVAAITTLLFKKLKQPVVLGYIIAGFLVGPKIHILPTITETENIEIWAKIGVIILLFSLGLEFSFRKLLKVGTVAVITAMTGVGMTMFLGYYVGKLLGWSNMDSLFLGGVLAIASTTIIIRAFEELGVKTKKFTGVVMGVLVIEDLVAVVLMVILSTVAISQTFQGEAMVMSVMKLVFFLIIWFVSGIFFLPTLFKKIRNHLTDETLLIVSLALCFFMVIFATMAGFSEALGAFIMGSLLAETTKVEKIEHLIVPIKNLFGAIFFVSVGMLIDPQKLIEYWFPVLVSVLVLLIGKPFFVTIGALVAGQPLKVAVRSGMSLSQIGEFSFIIANLGLTLKVTSDFLYPIAVAVSVITTFTTPYMIKNSEFVYKFLDTNMPERWKNRLNAYSAATQTIRKQSDWRILLRSYSINVAVFSVIVFTLILLSTNYLEPLLAEYPFHRILTLSITLVVLSPFIWALAFRRNQPQAYANIWVKPLQRGPLVVLMLARMGLALFFLGMLFQQLFSPLVAIIGMVLSLAFLYYFRKKIQHLYGRIESRFLYNLNERERLKREEEEKKKETIIAPWDSHMARFVVNANSQVVGKELNEIKMRENFGVNIAVIERGELIINVPGRNERLYPEDVLMVIGTDEQLEKFKHYIDVKHSNVAEAENLPPIGLQLFTIDDGSWLIHQTIRSSGVREKTNGMVVGVEREGERILNPESDFEFNVHDKIWMVGNEEQIALLSRDQYDQDQSAEASSKTN